MTMTNFLLKLATPSSSTSLNLYAKMAGFTPQCAACVLWGGAGTTVVPCKTMLCNHTDLDLH